MGDPEYMHQLTLLMVKPHAYKNREEIIKKITDDTGVFVVEENSYSFDEKMARKHYSEHLEKPFFPEIMEMVLEGPSMRYLIAGTNSIDLVRKACGPTDSVEAKKIAPDSIRAKYGKDKCRNAVHASDSEENALREIDLHFGLKHVKSLNSVYKKVLDSYKPSKKAKNL